MTNIPALRVSAEGRVKQRINAKSSRPSSCCSHSSSLSRWRRWADMLLDAETGRVKLSWSTSRCRWEPFNFEIWTYRRRKPSRDQKNKKGQENWKWRRNEGKRFKPSDLSRILKEAPVSAAVPFYWVKGALQTFRSGFWAGLTGVVQVLLRGEHTNK